MPLPAREADEDHMHRPEQLSRLGSRIERALAGVCSAISQAAPGLDALDAK